MKISIPLSLRVVLLSAYAGFTMPVSFAQETITKNYNSENAEHLMLGGSMINHEGPIGETSIDLNKHVIINLDGVGFAAGEEGDEKKLVVGAHFLNDSYPDIIDVPLGTDPLWGNSIYTSAKFDASTTIDIKSSYLSMITGGSLTYFYDATNGFASEIGHNLLYHGVGEVDISFKGDSKITIDENSRVGFVVGGNFGNSKASSFEGNTYIVSNQAVFEYNFSSTQYNNHGVVGASIATNESDISFTGTTNVTLTGMLTEFDAWERVLNGSAVTFSGTYGSVIGGLSGDYRRIDSSFRTGDYLNDPSRVLGQDMTDKVGTLVGNTNVTIDHSAVTLADSPTVDNFIYTIVGGSVVGNGMDIKHVSDADTGEGGVVNLEILSQDSINFQKAVVGGNVNLDAESVHQLGRLLLMREDLSETITSKVNVHVTGGNFAAQSAFSYFDSTVSNPYDYGNMFISGSLSYGGGKVTTTEVESTIDGGLFDVLVGANASTASMETNVQSGSSWQQGDYIVADGALYGAYNAHPGLDYSHTRPSVGVDNTSGSMRSDKATLTIKGGSSNLVVAGNYIASEVTHITGGIRKDETGQAVLDSQGNAIRDGGTIESLVSTLGSSNLTITGGTHQNITGGSFIGANITTGSVAYMGENHLTYEATQGDVSITLSGAGTTIKGDFIAAAGIIETFTTDAFLARYISSKFAKAMYEAYQIPGSTGVAPLPVGDLAFSAAKEATLKMTTENTSINLGADVQFESEEGAKVTISGGYQTVLSDATDTVDNFMSAPSTLHASADLENFMQSAATYAGWFGEDWVTAYNEFVAEFADITHLEATGAIVTGNRLLNLSDNSTYNNLANVAFVDFDELSTGAGAVVDFGLNSQDLDSFNARNYLAADATRVSEVAGEYMAGTNSLRKTGEGTLILGVENGQVKAEDNLQLVVEQGTLVLAAGSHTKTDFQTLVIQNGSTTGKGAVLDISRATYLDGEYQSDNVGINGDLRLEASTTPEEMLTIVADASRDALGSGAMMTGGSLSLVGEGQITLSLINHAGVDMQSSADLTEGSHFIFGDEDFYEIVLFSNLLTHNLEFDSTLTGTLNGEDAIAVLASKYLSANSNFNVEDAYLVYSNGDLMLTGAYYVPEPSTATLSLLALAGLLARRRRSS